MTVLSIDYRMLMYLVLFLMLAAIAATFMFKGPAMFFT